MVGPFSWKVTAESIRLFIQLVAFNYIISYLAEVLEKLCLTLSP